MLLRAAPSVAKTWYELRDACIGQPRDLVWAAQAWALPMMLTPSTHPPNTNSSPAFAFMHFNKGGGTTQKELLVEMARRKGWAHYGAGALNKVPAGAGTVAKQSVHWWNVSNAHRYPLLWGSHVLGQAGHTGRPVLYWTSMRDATARAISAYNQRCVCGIEGGVWTQQKNCNKTLEEATVDEAYGTLTILLGVSRDALRHMMDACTAAGRRDDLAEALLTLATTQLRQPCMSALRLSHIDEDVQRLNKRWNPLGFELPTSVPHANADQRGGKEGTAVCTSPRLVDAHDEAVIARAEAAGQADAVGALVRRLNKWHEAAADELWSRPLALCAH